MQFFIDGVPFMRPLDTTDKAHTPMPYDIIPLNTNAFPVNVGDQYVFSFTADDDWGAGKDFYLWSIGLLCHGPGVGSYSPHENHPLKEFYHGIGFYAYISPSLEYFMYEKAERKGWFFKITNNEWQYLQDWKYPGYFKILSTQTLNFMIDNSSAETLTNALTVLGVPMTP